MRPAVRLAALLAALAGGCASRPQRPGGEELARRQRSAAEAARRHDDPRTAASLYGRASRSAAAVDRPLLAADAACRQGIALLAAGEARRAAEAFARAAPLARDGGDPALAARALLGLARARSVDGGDAATPLRDAVALARGGKDAVAEALAEVGLGALAPAAEARERYAAAERLAGDAPAVAGPLRLNRARLDEREGRAAEARAGYRSAVAPLSASDDRVGLLAALRAAARHADADPAGGAEAADLHRRAALVADGLGRADVAAAERRAAEAAGNR